MGIIAKLTIGVQRKVMDKTVYEKMKDASPFELYTYFGPLLILNEHGEDHEREIAALRVILHDRGLTVHDLLDSKDANDVMKALTEDVVPLILKEGVDPQPMGNVATKVYQDHSSYLMLRGKPMNTHK